MTGTPLRPAPAVATTATAPAATHTAAAAAATSAPTPRNAPGRILPWAPLAVILAAQALLTIRLITGAAISAEEGRYIYAGHQLIREFWRGGGSPYYETFFPGAPVIYPVLAAMADHLGGLLEVRLMSLSFMMAATALLFVTARRLMGYLPAVLASAVVAGLGLTQGLGALATCGAMSLMLITAAAYCAVRTSDKEENASAWLLSVPLMLLLANATTYVTVISDPVVIILAALQLRASGWRRILARIAALGLATSALLSIALFVAGRAYLDGVLFSILDRSGGTSAVLAWAVPSGKMIMLGPWDWIGMTIAGSAAAALAFPRRDRSRAGGRRAIKGGVATLGMLGALLSGLQGSQAAASAGQAGASRASLLVAAALKPYLSLPRGRYLIGGPANEQLMYLDSASVPWFRLDDDLYIKYPIPGRGGDSHGRAPGRACFRLRPGCVYLEGPAGYAAAIRAHWFALVSLWGSHSKRQDAAIEKAVRGTPGYVLLTEAGGAPTWIYAPAYRGVANR